MFPSWFLRIAVPFLARPLSMLYNLSLSWFVVPLQWKSSLIRPVPKVSRPSGCSDYRPISVTLIVSRLLEKSMVTKFVYPIFVHPSCAHLFHDQFAFRPTGSTTAALIDLVHNLADLLQTYPYVHLIALDFYKAFDSVRHSTLMQKFSKLPLHDNIYNWITNFLMDRDHCTKLQGAREGFLLRPGLVPVLFKVRLLVLALTCKFEGDNHVIAELFLF